MLKMKKNKQIKITLDAGTNVEMTDDEFHGEVMMQINKIENLMNDSKIRYHINIVEE